MSAPTLAAPRPRGLYFFLSYDHLAPTADGIGPDTDHWVKIFYQDLSAAVAGLANPGLGLDIGFYDSLLPPGADWKTLVASALGSAEVFVPLYSPGYLKRSWPRSELASFRHRLEAAPKTAGRHLQPVLWIPLPPWTYTPEINDALELGSDTPAYAENGLQAMLMLGAYRRQYRAVLGRLASRIVTAAERTPLGLSPAPVLSEAPDLAPGETPFVVAVATPNAAQWRPFGGPDTLPIAQVAESVVERLDLQAKVVDVGGQGPRPNFESNPTLLLIDPWLLARPSGRARLESLIGQLRQWVTPVVVVDERDPKYTERGAALADEAIGMLSDVSAREVIRGPDEFVRVMPTLISLTRRNYLRHAPVFPPKDP